MRKFEIVTKVVIFLPFVQVFFVYNLFVEACVGRGAHARTGVGE